MMLSQVGAKLKFRINGKLVELDNVSPTLTLLRYLQQTRQTGTKEGCGDGDCGACTIVVLAMGADGQPSYQAMNSCLIPVASLAGREIITIEGIADETLHPVQAAMVETGGSQCGYCTPGFIMSMFAAYYARRVDDLSIEGNLCRCTGYLPIRRAAQQVAQANPDDRFSQKLQHSIISLSHFSYGFNQQQFYRPTVLSEVLNLLQRYPEAVLIAGGTDLGLEMSRDLRSFPVLISIEAVSELQGIRQTDDYIEIGAAVTLSHIQTNLRNVFPSLDEMLHWFAACQIRNRATIGGNIGTASPIGDLSPVLLSLDAMVRIASLSGERIVPIFNFFQSYRQTDLRSDEVIVAVRIPKTLASGAVKRLSQSYKVGKRGTDDISIVAAAFTIDVDKNNQIIQARLAYGGVAATPVRAIEVEAMLVGQPWNFQTVQQIKPILRELFTPLSDFRGSAEYRKKLVANLFEKFFVEMNHESNRGSI